MLKYGSFRNIISENRNTILYYFGLFVLIFLLLRPGVHIPTFFRMALLLLMLFPAFSCPNYLPFCMTCIVSISLNAFYPILPTDPAYYLIILILFYLKYKKISVFFVITFSVYFIFLYYSLAHGDFPKSLLWWLISIILADFVTSRTDIRKLMLAYLIVSFILSALFLTYKDFFLTEYRTLDGNMDRATWTNSNKFGAVIAAGGVMAVAYLSGIINVARSKGFKILSIVSIILVIPTLGLTASRGALLAFFIPSLLAILFSKMKTFIKVMIIIASVFLLYELFLNSQIFDLIAHRMQDETIETGGGRTKIWSGKLSAFFEFDYLTQFVGIGQSACTKLVRNLSTHNDFLTALIGYGYLGLLLFSLMMFLPLIKSTKRSRKAILLLTAYIIIECMVLEPFFRGYLFFLMFYLFTLKYALIERREYAKKIAFRHSKLHDRRDNRKYPQPHISARQK